MPISGNQGPTRFRPLYHQVKEHLIQRIVEGAWLPGSVLPSESQLAAEKRLPNTLYTLYQRRYGFSVLKAKESIKAVLASDEDVLLLGVGPGSPLLQIERIAFSIDGRPIELRQSRCVTDYYTYQVELT